MPPYPTHCRYTPTSSHVILLICSLLLLNQPVYAAMEWQTTSLSLLYGEHYDVNFRAKTHDQERRIITLEHASRHSWGDLFGFSDFTRSADQQSGWYAEISPRWSFGKHNLWRTNNSLLSDVLLAATLESGRQDNDKPDAQFTNLLWGIGLNWDIPGFRHLQTNIYRANNDKQDNDTQLTISWGAPFTLGASLWLYDGFIDWSSAASDHAASFNMTSQLKYDIGHIWNSPHQLYMGIEYVYWNNKFGIEDDAVPFSSNERNINLLVKYHF